MDIKVVKLNKTVELFNRDKPFKIAQAAGLTEKEASILADKMVEWLNSKKVSKISSRKLRDKMLEELRLVSTYAANLYIWYEKLKYEQKEKQG